MSESAAPATRAPGAPAARPVVPSWRLVATLAVTGALAGGLLVLGYQTTQPAIQAHKAEVLRRAVGEVLGGPERYDTLYVAGDHLAAEPPPGADPKTLESVYLGYAADGRPIGFAVVGAAKGYADDVRLIFGYDPRTSTILGLKVLESKETPGLGDAIEKDPGFYGPFAGKVYPIQGVKAGLSGGDPHKVDMITGATISSRTVIGVVQGALDRLDAVLRAHLGKEGT